LKKIVTILLLFIFLFNVTGYYFVQQILLEKSNEKISIAIDKNQYNKNQLIELRVPLNMPYYQNTSFQRQDGQINIKGITYNYVEKKIENGYLVLKCIQNNLSQQIKKNTNDYFANANGIDKSGNQKSPSSKTIAKVAFDDFEELIHYSFNCNNNFIFTSYPEYISSYIPIKFKNLPELPPEATV